MKSRHAGFLLGFFVVLALVLFASGVVTAADKDNNPPGPKGGAGTNWENPPGPAGGPGASPDVRKPKPGAKAPPPANRPPKKVFCERHPNDPRCKGVPPPAHVGLPPKAVVVKPPPPPKRSRFCKKNPWHKKCQPGYHHGNPPGPAGGPGAGYNPPGPAGGPGAGYNPPGPAGGPGAGPRYKDRDNNPPGKRGGPGTNWENPPGPKGGPGVSPNRKPPPRGKKR